MSRIFSWDERVLAAMARAKLLPLEREYSDQMAETSVCDASVRLTRLICFCRL